MGANWNEGMMRWVPYVDSDGRAYPLSHLHPFRYSLTISNGCNVEVRVTFAMHCFTRACQATDPASQRYQDERETRSFCPERYALSPRLPVIARTLANRRCGYARNDNYVTIDLPATDGGARHYGVFFNVLRAAMNPGGHAVMLTIQSAYALERGRPLPVRGSIHFARLVELTLQGIKPRPPRA